MRDIIGYRLTVRRGARAGMTRDYAANKGAAARRFADKLDREYGAICANVQPLFSYACTPASIAAEHAADMLACGVAL